MPRKVDDQTLLAFCLSGYSQTAIAKELHMTRTAICRRINSPAFQELLADYRNKVLDGVLTELLSHSQKAVLKLVELMDDENPFIALQAAKSILQLSQDYSIQKDLLRDIEVWKQTEENKSVYNRI